MTYLVRLTRSVRMMLLGAACLTTLAAQPRVLAPGQPPLTVDMATKAAGFFEWALDVRFTPAQNQVYQGMLIRDWSDPDKRKSTLELLKMVDKVATVPAETRDRVQAEVRRSLLESLRKETQDLEATWMIGVYDAAHPAGAAQAPVAAAASVSAPDAKRLTGKWRAGSVAMTQYRNAYTGASAPTSGNTFSYEFRPDGTYQYVGLMQITTYGCSSSVFNEHSGTYRVEGDRLYAQPSKGTVKSHVCGGQPTEKQDDLSVRVSTFHFENNSSGEMLVLGGTDGKATRPDYFRREK